MINQNGVLNDLDPDVMEGLTSRRDVLRHFGRTSSRALAMGSVPVALAVSAKSAFAQSGGALPEQVVDVLNFALTLEYLEATYYEMGLKQDGLIPDKAKPVFQTISGHEDAHVDFLKDALGDKAVKKPKFDFTAGGAFMPFEDYAQFKLLSQGFEDTGVRAYKGQVGELVDAQEILTAAITIHSVEARHAAIVRRLNDFQGWIPNSQPGVPKAVAPIYAGMDETTKFGVDVPKVSSVEAKQVTKAFDEPLSKQAVLDIVSPFLA